MDLSIFFAGTAGSAPTARRGLPSLLVRRGGDRILFDCGEGPQRQLVASVGLVEMSEIFLTHYHADHWLGLPGMLKTFDLRGRERPLAIHGPPGLRELRQHVEVGQSQTRLSFEIRVESAHERGVGPQQRAPGLEPTAARDLVRHEPVEELRDIRLRKYLHMHLLRS